jgi:hypothetical protein
VHPRVLLVTPIPRAPPAGLERLTDRSLAERGVSVILELGAKLAVFLPELVAFGFGGQIGALRNTLLKVNVSYSRPLGR